MPLLDFELVIVRKSTGERLVFNQTPSIPRIGEEVLPYRDSVTALKVQNVTHDFGCNQVILTTD